MVPSLIWCSPRVHPWALAVSLYVNDIGIYPPEQRALYTWIGSDEVATCMSTGRVCGGLTGEPHSPLDMLFL